MKVGFIGLGMMGSSMARNLLEGGYELVVHDIDRNAAASHVEAGAVWVDSPREVAEGCEVVFSSLPGPQEVEVVALGEHGLVHGVSAAMAYFEMSTSSPTLIRQIHEVFAACGAHVLDASVSGGPAGARSRDLALWVGGDETVYRQFKPVLDTIGDKAFHVGPIGTGAIAKLVHNCCHYVFQTAMAEALTMGVKAGADPLALWLAVRRGSVGKRGPFEDLARNLLPGRFEPADFALRLACKDQLLAVELGREFGVPMRLANLTLEEMIEALNRGWGERDSRASMLLQEERAGVEVRVPRDSLETVLKREDGLGE